MGFGRLLPQLEDLDLMGASRALFVVAEVSSTTVRQGLALHLPG
ncbi:protein of unknown function [Pararobbsia alpina]